MRWHEISGGKITRQVEWRNCESITNFGGSEFEKALKSLAVIFHFFNVNGEQLCKKM